jgi:hypothetical protein
MIMSIKSCLDVGLIQIVWHDYHCHQMHLVCFIHVLAMIFIPVCLAVSSNADLLRCQPMDFFRQQISGGIRASAGARVR